MQNYNKIYKVIKLIDFLEVRHRYQLIIKLKTIK